MRAKEPFRPDDLLALEALYERANYIVAMEDVGDFDNPDAIAVRHDCDNVIEPAVRMAEWEAERGYRTTYYILHTAPYWRDKTLLRESLEIIVGLGHKIGIHNDAITVALETGHSPAYVLAKAIGELRGYGFDIRSTVAHGNPRCHIDNYVNDEMFAGCRREAYGDIGRLGVTPVPLSEFGLDFDASWLPRGDYLSDSGGAWSQSFHKVAAAFPSKGQLHVLQHPCWWHEAFDRAQVAA